MRAALLGATAALAATDAPALTAQLLLAEVLGLDRTQVLTQPERPLSPAEQAAFAPLVARAAVNEPLAYLLGRREFYGLSFAVTPHVLVPRPETELLVDLARQLNPTSVLDVGTGSGCIAVALAVNVPRVTITALDLSPEALAVAQRNAAAHGVSDRIRLVHSDLLAALAPPAPSFDLLCANLPYIDTTELSTLPVAAHEPALALDGGPGGLVLVERLLAQAAPHLAPGAALLLEISATHGPAAAALAHAVFPAAAVSVVRDLSGLDRVLSLTLPPA